jgi:hypothetical protein
MIWGKYENIGFKIIPEGAAIYQPRAAHVKEACALGFDANIKVGWHVFLRRIIICSHPQKP